MRERCTIQATLKFFSSLLFSLIYSTNTHAFIYSSAALKAGYGTVVTTNSTTVPSTKMVPYAFDGSFGISSWGILIGVSGEYALVRQMDKPSSVSNVNSQGTLKAVYPMIGYDFLMFRILAKLPSAILGDYTLEKKNSSGQEVIYKNADVLGIQLNYKTSPLTFWGLEYQSLKFKKASEAGTESTLTSALQFKMNTYSIQYGFFF
jgi:hypothetical protein